MSFANIQSVFRDCQLAREVAEGERAEIKTLLAQWFLDSNEGARDFLREIARHARERDNASQATQEAAAAPAERLLSGSAGAAGGVP